VSGRGSERQRRRQRHARKEGRAGDRRRDAVRQGGEERDFFSPFAPLFRLRPSIPPRGPHATARGGVLRRSRSRELSGGERGVCVWTEARGAGAAVRLLGWTSAARTGGSPVRLAILA
jgi:hypothetical protein